VPIISDTCDAWLTPVSARTGLQVAEVGCVFCTSENEAEFPVEMMIHFSELKNVGNPGVWLFRRQANRAENQALYPPN